MSTSDLTFIMVKPDGVQRNLCGEIISRFEKKGLKLVAISLQTPSKEHLEEHYADLSSKPFFPSLITYMMSGPVLAMLWQGKNAPAVGRSLLGATNPLQSLPGTIRGDFAIDMGANICHGSDSIESGKKEAALWFPNHSLEYKKTAEAWVYEQ